MLEIRNYNKYGNKKWRVALLRANRKCICERISNVEKWRGIWIICQIKKKCCCWTELSYIYGKLYASSEIQKNMLHYRLGGGTMQKILIVEDDVDIQDILKNHLIDAGYEVAVTSDGVEGIAMFDDTIDLVLLDIMLHKIDGYGVCEVIRKRSQIPIIMLTALSDEENQLRGFEQQIDDYIPKPFSPKILLCKIAAILRRRTAENQNQSLLTYKELSMDVDGFHVYQGGNEVVLTSKEFALLRLMLENQGKVFTRQMLLDRLWAENLEVEDRIVDSHIKNIRKKLNADYIKTIRGVGYRIDKVH